MSRIWLTLTLSVILLTQASWAAFTEVARKDHAETFAAATAPEQEDYNFKLGSSTTNLVSTVELEYDDNISRINTNKIDDFILRLGLQSKTIWPITELNALTLDLDMGYRYYFNNPDLSSDNNFLDINPGSELALEWWIRDFSFKIYDELSYSVDSGDVRVFVPGTGITNNVIEYARIENRAGLDIMWDLNDLKVFFGYSRDDLMADKASFNTLDRTEHSLYVTPMVSFNPALSVGWMNRFYWNDYDVNYQNDSDGFITGPTASYQLSANTTVTGDLYWHYADFDSTGTSGDTNDLSTWNGRVTLDQDLNARLAHSLTVEKSSNHSSIANYEDAKSISYRPTYLLRDNMTLEGRFSYSDTEDSGTANAEDAILRGYGATLYYDLNDRMSLDTTYDHIVKTSNIAARNYDDNRIIMKLTYDF